MSERPLIFISHATDESASAMVIEQAIRYAFGDAVSIFNTSNRQSLAVGDPWRDQIIDALRTASSVLVICSPSSVKNGWIHFEAGGAWSLGKSVVPCCIKGMKPVNLPTPLRDLQSVELTADEGFSQLFSHLARVHSELGSVYKEVTNVRGILQHAWEADAHAANTPLISFAQSVFRRAERYKGQSETGLLVIKSIYPTKNVGFELAALGVRSGESLKLSLDVVGAEGTASTIFDCYTTPDVADAIERMGEGARFFGELKCLGLLQLDEMTTKQTICWQLVGAKVPASLKQ
jgi:hypothetical protein